MDSRILRCRSFGFLPHFFEVHRSLLNWPITAPALGPENNYQPIATPNHRSRSPDQITFTFKPTAHRLPFPSPPTHFNPLSLSPANTQHAVPARNWHLAPRHQVGQHPDRRRRRPACTPQTISSLHSTNPMLSRLLKTVNSATVVLTKVAYIVNEFYES